MQVKGLIIDIDGVLVTQGSPTKDSIEFIRYLRKNKVPFCLLTNSGEIPKNIKLHNLNKLGFDFTDNELITASELTINYLKKQGIKNIILLSNKIIKQNFSKYFNIVEMSDVDAVVIGDWYEEYNKSLHFISFKAIQNGARILAIHTNRTWSDGINDHLDIGFWVKGFEYVSSKAAIIIGKPSKYSYRSALKRLNVCNNSTGVYFISDDVDSDLKGAKECGIETIHFCRKKQESEYIDYHTTSFEEIIKLFKF